MANWLDLHQDLLVSISNFCIISDVCVSPDYIRMQSLCKSWRSILKKKMQRELPWLMMLPNKEEEDPDARVFFSVSKQKIHTIPLPEMRGKRCCGSFQNGWLMFVDDKLDICLFHPWSKKKIHLPPQSTFKKPNFVNEEDDDEEVGTYSMEEIRDGEILRAALSDDGKMVVVLYGLGHLGFCRIGEDDSYADVESDSMMEDVIYHKGHFYALSQRGSLYLLYIDNEDSFHPHAEKLTLDLDTDDDPLPYVFVAHLVPDILTDTMFVITREGYGHKTIHFDIFGVSNFEEGADEKTLKKFTKIESLGDRVLFLGYNSPMIIMASQFPGFKGNHIYFTDSIKENYFLSSNSSNGCRDLGVFSVEDRNVKQLFADRFHPIFSPPIWIATPPYSS